MRLALLASSRNAALRAVAELAAEGCVADVSIQGRLYLVHVECGDEDAAAVLRRVQVHDPGARLLS